MATIPAPDLVLLRTTQHRVTPYLSVLQPTTLLTARVNNGAITRGARTIAYDGGGATGFADIEAGQTLWVGEAAGGYNVGKVRIKTIVGNQAAGTITIDENAIDWVDDLYLTVKWNYEIWPVPPRISGGIFYKFYSTTYTDQNETPNPVAIAGTHRAGFLDPVTDDITFDLDGSDSYATADGAAITTYLWAVDGPAAAVIANANIATTTITFSTVVGTYWVSLTVTDDNGKTQKTYRAYFVHNVGSYPPVRNFNIGNISGDWNSGGWSASIEVFGDDVELSDFPDGSLAVLWYENYFDDAEDYVNVWGVSNEVLCAGYIQTESDSDNLDNGDGGVSFSIVTPEALLTRRTEMGTVSIEAVANPAYWYEYESWLTVGRAIHHLLKWHSTVMETCDVYGLLDNTLGMKQAQFVEESLLARINGLAYDRGIFARMNSDRLGRLHLVEDIQYFDETDRAALDTVFSITLADLSGTISLAREPVKQTAMAFLDGFDFDGSTSTPLISIIPGYIDTISLQIPEFEGGGTINKTRQVLDSQADSNMKAGRVLADANNPLRELRATLRGNYTGAFDIIPSLGWYGWGVANATFKRNLSLLNTKWVCRRVELSFPTNDVFSGDLETTVILEGEAFGPDGIPGNYPTGYPTIKAPDPNWTPEVIAPLFDTYTAGDDMEFEDDEVNEVVVTRLSDTEAFILYNRDLGGGNLSLWGTVIGWNGAVISTVVGTTELDSAWPSIQNISVSRMDANHVICTYNYSGESEFYGLIVEISGAAFNIGSPTRISSGVGAGGSFGGKSAIISFAYAMTVYTDDGGLYAQIIGLDGGMQAITINTPELVDALGTNPTVVNVATGVAIVGYLDNSTDGRSRTITYVNDVISAVNTETIFEPGQPDSLDIAKIDNTHAIIGYIDTDNSNYLTVCLLTLTSAISITAASPVVISANDSAVVRLVVFNTSTAGILFSDSLSSNAILQLLDILNSPVSSSGAGTVIFNNEDFFDIDKLSDTETVIVYGWPDSANEGIVEVGELTV